MSAQQLEIRFPDKNRQRRGGARPGAGRKPKNGVRAGQAHASRPKITAHQPVHVTMRVRRGGSLRKRHLYKALHWAVAICLRRQDFRVVHVSIQHDHVHLIVEADSRDALGKGLRGFAISAARGINAARGTRGNVFPDRYHCEVITCPRQARNTLAYVLNNWRKHREDRRVVARAWRIDPFSSGACFGGWLDEAANPMLWAMPPTYDRMMVSRPRSWLLRKGWQAHGLISIRDVPSRRAAAPARSS
jgi:REP element-mobilizing transposase RayT